MTFHKRLLDNANDLIWATDMEGRFTYINENIAEWGYDKGELIGQPLLNILNTKYVGKRYEETSNKGLKSIFEMEILDKRGKAHTVIVSSSPLQDDDGKIIGTMGIIRDVSETQKLEEKLKNEERFASLGRLATGIAHEIRNPLSSVKMNLDILRRRLTPQGEDDEHFKIAQQEVANLERIVTELIDYAKPTPFNLQREDMNKTVEDVMSTAKAACIEGGVTLSKRFARNMPLTLIDKGKMNQALLNIIINAIQASRPGGRVVVETQFVKTPSPMARISVSDYGTGIKPEDIKFVFDPFFTTKKSGAGLGLSIVKNIINNHNGTISVESEMDKGTTVRMEIPIR
ncbi:MAG: PAS domain S-box protein [Nitrospinae bacterium]|nr:PAS domain S-box protein [Nitrospinota bacterium]